VTSDPLVLIAEVDRATARLLATARTLDDAAVHAPSPLPGWTRGHVLTHVARNADSLINLLTWARTGIETPQYPSHEAREAGIRAGAPRPAADQVADLEAASERFVRAVEEMPAEAWGAVVSWRSGRTQPAARIVWARLTEVEIHHVDLDAGYTPADWPDAFSHRLLHDLANGRTEPAVRVNATDIGHTATIGAGSPTVSGPGHTLAAWLTGRSSGDGLTVDPDGPLPPVPTWS
jgi:maleylpyruvate isomerase